jgi:hypothetical protein
VAQHYRLVDGQIVPMTDAELAEATVDVVPAVPERRRVSKTVVRQRVADAGKIAEAVQFIIGDPDLFSRWTLPGSPDVYFDDPDTIAVIQAIGLDPEQILAAPDTP